MDALIDATIRALNDVADIKQVHADKLNALQHQIERIRRLKPADPDVEKFDANIKAWMAEKKVDLKRLDVDFNITNGGFKLTEPTPSLEQHGIYISGGTHHPGGFLWVLHRQRTTVYFPSNTVAYAIKVERVDPTSLTPIQYESGVTKHTGEPKEHMTMHYSNEQLACQMPSSPLCPLREFAIASNALDLKFTSMVVYVRR